MGNQRPGPHYLPGGDPLIVCGRPDLTGGAPFLGILFPLTDVDLLTGQQPPRLLLVPGVVRHRRGDRLPGLLQERLVFLNGTQQDPGRDRLGRRAKRFLSPSEKYELWLQLVTGELSQSEAAERFGVDRSTVMRIR